MCIDLSDNQNIPPLHALQLLHLVSVAVQCTVKVGHTVSGCKTAEDTGVMDGVRCGYIDDLEIHFGGIFSFVTTKLHPHFSLGYDAVMPLCRYVQHYEYVHVHITFTYRYKYCGFHSKAMLLNGVSCC